MPGFDRTGPEGRGPMTGWRRGYCAGTRPRNDDDERRRDIDEVRGEHLDGPAEPWYGPGTEAGYGSGPGYGRGMAYRWGLGGFGRGRGRGFGPGRGQGRGYGRGGRR